MPETVTLAPNVVLRVIGGEALLLKLGAEDVFSLNDTGTRIVQLLEEGRDVTGVVDILTREYQVDRAVLEEGVADLITVLTEKGLVVRRADVGS